MAKVVLIASDHSNWQDIPGRLYHFPNQQYLSVIQKAVKDWAIFYAGRRGGNLGYYAVQRIELIEPDPANPGYSYAVLDQSSLWSFENNVPRLGPNGLPFESGLPLSRGSNSSAVRLISEADFAAIVTRGLSVQSQDWTALPRKDLSQSLDQLPGFHDPETAWHGPTEIRIREKVLSSRSLRDQSFARQVRRAYAGKCAISGLELRNGGGRSEVEAAHILPVEENGPDTVSNGLALTGTIHWMFDRGLISVDEDYSLLVAKESIAAEVADRLFMPERRLLTPVNAALRPHPGYLRWHRENRFKG